MSKPRTITQATEYQQRSMYVKRKPGDVSTPPNKRTTSIEILNQRSTLNNLDHLRKRGSSNNLDLRQRIITTSGFMKESNRQKRSRDSTNRSSSRNNDISYKPHPMDELGEIEEEIQSNVNNDSIIMQGL